MPDWESLANTNLALRRNGQLGGELFPVPSSNFHSLILVTPKNGPTSVVGYFFVTRGVTILLPSGLAKLLSDQADCYYPTIPFHLLPHSGPKILSPRPTLSS